MKIKNEFPPNYQDIIEAFDLKGQKTLFTYGDTVYDPYGGITDDLIVHEQTHIEQQGGNDVQAGLWWKLYLADPEFRLKEEISAYVNQYKYLCKRIKDRNKRFRILNDIAGYLSGPIYGNAISKSDALQKLQNKVK